MKKNDITINDGDLEIVLSNTSYTNQKIYATINILNKEINIEDYIIQYKFSEDSSWNIYKHDIEIIENGNLTVRLKSKATGQSKITISKTIFNIDKDNPSKPTLAIVNGTKGENGWYTSNVEIKVNKGTDETSSVSKLTYALSGANIKVETQISESDNIIVSNEGITKVEAYCYDEAGNKSEVVDMNVKLDTTAPNILCSEEEKVNIDTILSADYINKKYEISDNLSNVSVLNIRVKDSSSNIVNEILNGYDIYEVTYSLKDEAGNNKNVNQKYITKPKESLTLTNAFTNSGFEYELSNWYNYELYRSSQIKRSGNYSMYFTVNNNQAFAFIKLGNIGANGKNVYTRAYILRDSDSTCVNLWSADMEFQDEWCSWTNRSQIGDGWFGSVEDKWCMHSNICYPESLYDYFQLEFVQGNTECAGNVYWDDIMVVVLDENVWGENMPTIKWLDEMIPDFEGTENFSW